jgi:hypothetical protein
MLTNDGLKYGQNGVGLAERVVCTLRCVWTETGKWKDEVHS